ncbi:retention module-containing protein, partial [Leeia oryzae]|uniref:retention module-containing protein n=1 Tax=Leeia oryzae TaxID=356662 RepID=UPI0003663630
MVISSVKGRVIVRDENGLEHAAQPGEVLTVGEKLITGADGLVELAAPDGGNPITLAANKELLIDADIFGTQATDNTEAAIAQLNQGDVNVAQALAQGQDLTANLDPTAAGLNAGTDATEGHSFVRLLRIVEGTSPLGFGFAGPADNTHFETIPGTVLAVPAPVESVPVAVDDTNTVTEDSETTTVSGNVLTNDTVGADVNPTPITPTNGTIYLQYGWLTLHSDGTYTYTLDNSNPNVNKLNTEETLHDTYTYTLTDGNGSTATAVLDITINGHTDAPPTITIPVTEGAIEGSDTTLPETAAATAGYFTITADAGIHDLQIGNTNLTLAQLQALNTTHVTVDTGSSDGTLILTGFDETTGVVSYTYDPNVLHHTDGTPIIDSISITVTDDTAVSRSDTLDIAITDTGPVAVDDSNSITEDAIPNTVEGNVLTGSGADTVGADTNATPVTPVTDLALTYGTLTLHADGSYTYTLDNSNADVNKLNDGETLHDTYTYTLTDGDGTTTTAVLDITIHGNTDGITIEIPVTEGAIEGSDTTLPETAAATAGYFTITAEAGIHDIQIGNTNLTLAQLQALNTTHVTVDTGSSDGTLILTGFDETTGVVSYTYDPNVLHHTDGVPIIDSISITLTDDNAVSQSDTLDIAITDTGPTAVDDSNSITENATPNTVSGNVLTGSGADTVGADTNANPVTAVTDHALSYGTLTLNADGSYTYTLDNSNADVNKLNDGQTLHDTYTYTLTDGDGTTTTAVLDITIVGHTDTPPSIIIPDTDGDLNTTDTTLPETAGATAGTFTISAEAGIHDIQIGNTNLTLAQLQALDSTHTVTVNTGSSDGTLILTGFDESTGVVSYTYDPNVLHHTDGLPIIDSISITLTDDNAISQSDTLDIAITDTGPTAVDDSNSITENAIPNTVSGNVLTGSGADTVGADTNANPVTAVTDHALSYGTLTLNADGSYTYTLDNSNSDVNKLNDGQTLHDTYTYTLTDGDGTQTTAVLDITIHGTNDAPVIDLDGDNSSGQTGSDFITTFTENGTGVAISDSDISITDVDNTKLASATITLTNSKPGDVLTVGDLTALGISANVVGNVVTLTGAATLAEYQAAIKLITFSNTTENPDTTQRDITVVVNDGTADSNVAHAYVNVIAVNDAPINAVSDAVTTPEDTSKAISGLSISDVDAVNGSMTVTLTVAHGVLSVTGNASNISGNGSGTVTLTGTVAEINAILAANVTYMPAHDYNGTDTLTMVTNDNGNTGVGGSLQDVDTVNITVTPVNDAPVALPDNYSAVEGATTILGSVLSNDSDVDNLVIHAYMIASNAAGTGAVAANGSSSITTALGGTVVMNADGTFSYTAPVRDHADAISDQDSFYYQATDGSGQSTWVKVSVDITDTNPTAVNDYNEVAWLGSVSGNVLTNDVAVDVPKSLVSVTSDGVTKTFAASSTSDAGGKYITFTTTDGNLKIYEDGHYTYTSTKDGQQTLSGSSLPQWLALSDLYGFGTTAWKDGSGNLVLSSLTSTAAGEVDSVNGSKPGIGVGALQSAAIDPNETLVIHLHETTNTVTMAIAQYNANQASAYIWRAYDTDGVLITSGTFSSSVSNGTIMPLTVTANTAIAYIAFSNESGNAQGYVLSSISYTAPSVSSTDTFTYVMQDQDGDQSTATLSVTPTAGTITLDLDSSGAGTGFTGTFTENGSSVAIADTDISITGTGASVLKGATVTLANGQAGDVLTV